LKRDKSILLGVTGGIAAIKAALLASKLTCLGYKVYPVLTPAACQFLSPLTLSTLTGQIAKTEMFEQNKGKPIHLAHKDKADFAAIIPATADFIAKIAHGFGDDLLSTVLLSMKPQSVLIAPAMNPSMYKNPAVKDNLSLLSKRGYHIVKPVTGRVACGDDGEGRLPEVEDLILEIERLCTKHDLEKEHLIITLGATSEAIDSVRIITNRSSGRMGLELARSGYRRGARVSIIAGRCDVKIPKGFNSIKVETYIDLSKAIEGLAKSATGLIMAIAVADFKPKEVSGRKIKRGKISLDLKPIPDVLAKISKKQKHLKVIAFSLQDNIEEDNMSISKMKEKGASLIVVNEASAIDGEESRIRIIDRDLRGKTYPIQDKSLSAELILDAYKHISK